MASWISPVFSGFLAKNNVVAESVLWCCRQQYSVKDAALRH
jgi:hypothetical protein